MLSAAAASEDDRRRREQERPRRRRMAEMAAAKKEGRPAAEDAEAERRVAVVVVAGTTTEDNLAEAEPRGGAGAARQIERARSGAEELRVAEHRGRREAPRRADQQRAATGRRAAPIVSCLRTGVATEDAGHADTCARYPLGTRPAFDSKQRDFVAFLASINLAHYAPS